MHWAMLRMHSGTPWIKGREQVNQWSINLYLGQIIYSPIIQYIKYLLQKVIQGSKPRKGNESVQRGQAYTFIYEDKERSHQIQIKPLTQKAGLPPSR
jgi:hypothetical protein